MSDDPVRWKDGGDDAPPAVRDAIVRARPAPPLPDDVRAAVLGSLLGGALPPTSPASGGASGASSASTAGGAAKAASLAWWGAGAAVVLAGAVAIVSSTLTPPSSPAPAPALSPSPSPSPAPAPAPTTASSEPESAPTASPAPSPHPPPVARPSSHPTASAPPPSAPDTLAEESALVSRARTSIASNPAAALVAVDEHARRFPKGELTPEREYLRVRALRALGRNDEARERGKRYLAQYPSSPYIHSVRTILTELESK